jgi:hypothetical protein
MTGIYGMDRKIFYSIEERSWHKPYARAAKTRGFISCCLTPIPFVRRDTDAQLKNSQRFDASGTTAPDAAAWHRRVVGAAALDADLELFASFVFHSVDLAVVAITALDELGLQRRDVGLEHSRIRLADDDPSLLESDLPCDRGKRFWTEY